jgi:hypothetical protein
LPAGLLAALKDNVISQSRWRLVLKPVSADLFGPARELVVESSDTFFFF